MKSVSARIRAVHLSYQAMTPEQEQELKVHLQAIAKILYDESDLEAMTTLEGIELTVRQQMQKYVSPQRRSFLSKRLQERK
jgi:hypothetical protein